MQFKKDFCLTAQRRSLKKPLCARRSRTGTVQVYEQPVPTNPDTPDQRAVRSAMTNAADDWGTLSLAQKQAWAVAAQKLEPEFPTSRGRLTGYMLYTKCWKNTQLLSLGAPVAAPKASRPKPPTKVTLEPFVNARSFAFRVHHHIRNTALAKHRVLVMLTPATVHNHRKPEKRNRRMIGGYEAASFVELPPSGEIIRFDNTEFKILRGQRFGAWLRILRVSDGLDCEDLFLDLTR